MKTALGRLAALTALVTLGTLNVGCMDIGAVVAGDRGRDSDTIDEFGGGTFDVHAVSLTGNLGDVHGFSSGVWLESGAQYGDVATIEIQSKSEAEGWAVMSALDIEGGVDHPQLTPGAVLSFRRDDTRPYDPTALSISLLGCSGPDSGSWDFDRHADQVTVEVQEGPTGTQRRIHYTGVFEDGSVLDGTVDFTYR